MNIFNSLGSNYDLKFALKALFAQNKESYGKKLKDFLEKKYEGRAVLVYKGREAIGLALEILNLPKDSFVAINGFTCYAVYKAIINEGYDAVCLDLEDKFPNRHSGERSQIPSGTWRSVEDSRISNGNKRFRTRRVPYGNPSSQNDELDLNFSANEFLRALKHHPKIKAVIIQNTLGYPCDIEKIAKICKDNNIILIEDLAHSVGTVYKNGKAAGTIGDFVVLSFSQDKIIDAISGGALIIRNKKYQHNTSPRRWQAESHDSSEVDDNETINSRQQLLDRLYPLFTFAIRKTYRFGLGKIIHFFLKSFNLLSKPMNESFYERCSLPSWYAHLVVDSFNKLSKNLEHRKRIATIYNTILNKKVCSKLIEEGVKLSSNLRYPIFVENRQSLIKYLKKEKVYVSDIWYDDVDKSLPNAQIVANTILNLPTHRNVSEKDARKIAQEINQSLTPPLSLRERERVRVIGQNDGVEMNSKTITKTIDSIEEWESFLEFHPEANFLQSWQWGEFHKNLNNDIQRTGFYEGNKLIGVMLSIVEDAKRGRYLTVPGGPIIDWQNPNIVDAFVEEIKRIAKEQSCVFVRVRPQLESSDFSKNLFKQHGFINAPMHLHAELTTQLDITKDEQTLLSQMRKTTRYEIKKAISQKIKITASTDPSLIKKFYELQIETAKRQKFVPFSYNFLYEQFRIFARNDQALLYEARLENTLLAQAFIIFYNQEAVYHYGASTEEGRKYPGAYLIQWEAIKEAKKRGMTRYNFWGVSPIDQPDHRFYGLSLFKRGFGGQDVEYLHAQDLIINYPRYLINYAVERIRKITRGV